MSTIKTTEKRFVSLKKQEKYEDKVMEFIDNHFVLNDVEIKDYPFFLRGMDIKSSINPRF